MDVGTLDFEKLRQTQVALREIASDLYDQSGGIGLILSNSYAIASTLESIMNDPSVLKIPATETVARAHIRAVRDACSRAKIGPPGFREEQPSRPEWTKYKPPTAGSSVIPSRTHVDVVIREASDGQ